MVEYSLETIELNTIELEEAVLHISGHRYQCLKIQRLIVDIKKLISSLKTFNSASKEYVVEIEAAVSKLKKAQNIYEEIFPSNSNSNTIEETTEIVVLPSGKEYTIEEIESLVDKSKKEPDKDSSLQFGLDEEQRDIII